MDKITFFPPINNIRMAPYNRPLPAAYHYSHFDEAHFIAQQRPYQLRGQYCQKVQYTDTQNLWFYSSGTVTLSLLYIQPHSGQTSTVAVLDVIDQLQTTPTLYNYEAENGNIYALTTYGYLFKFLQDTHLEGYYCFLAHVVYEDESTEDYVSEPLWVRASHKNTIRLKYRNSSDDFDIMFEEFYMSFCLRFDSDFMTMEPASDDVVYTDQGDNVRRLYGNPYRVFKLNIGGSIGVPEWMIDKINRAFSTDVFLIDGKRYVKQDGAKFDSTVWNTYPLQVSSIELREFFNGSAGAFLNPTPVRLYYSPGTYPFAIPEWRMRDANGNEIFGGFIEFNSSGDEAAYATFYNDVVVPQHDLQGTFSYSGGYFTYTNGDGEAFTIVTQAPTLQTYFEATVNVLDETIPFSYLQGGTGYHLLVSNSGIDNNAPMVTESGVDGLGNPIMAGELILYGSSGNKKLRIYTPGTMLSLQFKSQFNKITAINPDSAVAALKSFWANGQNFGNTDLNLAFLAGAKNSLKELNLGNSNIKSIAAGWASAYVSGTYRPFGPLKFIFLDYNKFNAAAEDAFVNELFNDVFYGAFGQLSMTNQNPHTAPTSTSGAARTALAFVHWTLTF